jgi:hypothetical protein
MASQVRLSLQEEVYEYSGDGGLEEGKANQQLHAYREGLRAKLESDGRGEISTTVLSPSDAFEVFSGKVFSALTEFSQADMVERRAESPIQRLSRLRAELEELKGDLDTMVQVTAICVTTPPIIVTGTKNSASKSIIHRMTNRAIPPYGLLCRQRRRNLPTPLPHLKATEVSRYLLKLT